MATTLDLILTAREEWTRVFGEAGGAVDGLAKRTRGASLGVEAFDTAAKHAARGGVLDLASQIPVVGGALGSLAHSLSGFPLLLGGIIGVGAGVIAFLDRLNAGATKSLASMTALAEGIGTRFRDAVINSQLAIAQANQDRLGSIALTYEKEVATAKAAQDKEVAAAKTALDEVLDSTFSTYDDRQQALQKYSVAVQVAEGNAAAAGIEADARRKASLIELGRAWDDLGRSLSRDIVQAESQATAAVLQASGQQLAAVEASAAGQQAALTNAYNEVAKKIRESGLVGDQLTAALLDAQQAYAAKSLALTTKTEEDRKQIIVTATSSALTALQGLGTGTAGGGLSDVLGAAEFVQQSQDTIKALTTIKEAVLAGNPAYASLKGNVTLLDAAIAKLGEDAKRAAETGLAPLKSTLSTADLTGLLEQATKSGTALANLGKNAAESSAAVRQLVDAGAGATRGFDEMNNELISLLDDLDATNQALTESVGLYASAGEGAVNLAASLDEVANASQRAAQAQENFQSTFGTQGGTVSTGFQEGLPPKPGGGQWTLAEIQRLTPAEIAALWQQSLQQPGTSTIAGLAPTSGATVTDNSQTTVTVNVATGANPQEIAAAVSRILLDAQRRRTTISGGISLGALA